jgi:arsenate reductase
VTITIYHNPKCATSRYVLATIRECGVEPVVIEYLKAPPTRARLQELIAAMGIAARALLRRKEAPYAALGLDDPRRSEDEILDAMVANPILIERRRAEGGPSLPPQGNRARHSAIGTTTWPSLGD